MEERTEQIEQEQVTEQPQEQVQQEQPESTPEEVAPAIAKDADDNSAESNFRKLREKTEKIERERDQAFAILRQIDEETRKQQQQQLLQQQQLQKQQAMEQQKAADQQDIDIDNDDYTSRRYVDRKNKKLQDEVATLKREQAEQLAKSQAYITESQLRAKHKDWDQVIAQKNIEALRDNYPDLAHSIASNPDLRAKANAAYTAIKKLGIYTEDTFSNDRKKAEANSNKPRPSNSINSQQGNSPLTKANAFAGGLTDDLKKQLFKEMTDARNQG